MKSVQLISAFVFATYIDSTIPLLPKSKISSPLASSVVVQLFVSELFRNPEDRFSHDVTHIIYESLFKQCTTKVYLSILLLKMC